MDMRDRLSAGQADAQAELTAMAQAAASRKKRWWQIFSRKRPSLHETPGYAGLENVVQANRLAIEGIDQALARWHVALIDCEGHPLDTETMKVVGQMTDSEYPEGTVVKVLRVGYTWNGTLSRPAEVCVVASTTE